MRPATLLFRSALAALFASAAAAADWPMYGRDLHHSFHNDEDTAISTANVSKLVHKWFFPTLDAVTASPAVVAGVVYVGDWHGFFWALDAETGLRKWVFEIDAYAPANPNPMLLGLNYPDRLGTSGGVITSSAAVADGKVYFAGGKTVYCLNAADGSLVWNRVVCGNPDAANCEQDETDPSLIFSSPAVFEGKVYVGVTQDGRRRSEMRFRGGFVAIDAATGAIVKRFETDRDGTTTGAVKNRSCGGVWSSAAIEEVNRLVVFNTADCDFDALPPFHEAILALDIDAAVWDDSALAWYYRPRESDDCDYDFGASPNVIDIGGVRHVGNAGKDGFYY
ncbi:MAG: PQQ-binding-like beta-propeller repeat protein, partial [Candidatus Binatia bacterium]